MRMLVTGGAGFVGSSLALAFKRDSVDCKVVALAAADMLVQEYGRYFDMKTACFRGGRSSNCSMLEAIALCEEIDGRPLNWSYSEDNRISDHIWWISDNRRFMQHYPEWNLTSDVPAILEEIHEVLRAHVRS